MRQCARSGKPQGCWHNKRHHVVTVPESVGHSSTRRQALRHRADSRQRPDTVFRLEKGEALHQRTRIAIREALEDAGVVFIDENGGGAGVRLRKAMQK